MVNREALAPCTVVMVPWWWRTEGDLDKLHVTIPVSQ